MTEYTTSSEAIREYLTSRERTARWVQQHYGHDVELLSPSVPPSSISDSDAPSYGPSDSEESSQSLPPRMFLRWTDGRPDMPVSSSSNYARSRSQSHPYPYSRRDESPDSVQRHPHPAHSNFHPSAGSRHPSAALASSAHSRHAQTLSYATAPFQGPLGQQDDIAPSLPEHIVVLPSPQEGDPPQVPGAVPSHVSHSHHGSQHLSRTPTAHAVHHPQPIPAGGAYPPLPSHQSTIHAPSPRHAYNPSHASHVSRHATHSPAMQQSHSQPLPVAHGGAYPSRPGTALPYTYSPPQIVYAPSSKHGGGSNYAPPQIVYSPPQQHGGAPSITYSQSAPNPLAYQHPRHGMSTAPSGPRVAVDSSRSRSRGGARGHGHTGSQVPSSHGRSKSISTRDRYGDDSRRGRSPTRSGSDTSGSTYYILPTPGQKVQIIVSTGSQISDGSIVDHVLGSQPPSGAPSLRTATSATKASQYSQHSPHSPHDAKKPFFQRIFQIPKLASSSTGSTTSTGRRLRRRHTLQVGAQAHGEH